MNLHLIHGPSTLHSTTTFGHHLRENSSVGNIAYCACVGRVRCPSPKDAFHGLWKPSSTISKLSCPEQTRDEVGVQNRPAELMINTRVARRARAHVKHILNKAVVKDS